MKNSFFKIFLSLLILFILAGSCAVSKKSNKKRKKKVLIETTHLGKNKKFFSKKYQKSLNSRAKKNRRKAKRRQKIFERKYFLLHLSQQFSSLKSPATSFIAYSIKSLGIINCRLFTNIAKKLTGLMPALKRVAISLKGLNINSPG